MIVTLIQWEWEGEEDKGHVLPFSSVVFRYPRRRLVVPSDHLAIYVVVPLTEL